jgi:anthranilate/para-aminobenzoate synthase component I
MPYLKVHYEKRALKDGESAQDFYMRLRGRYSFLMKSIDESGFSYIGYDPFMVVYGESDITAALTLKNEFGLKKSTKRQILDGKPMDILAKLAGNYALRGNQPLDFAGGMFGFFSYDFFAKENGIKQSVYDELKIPDFVFCLVDKLVALDHGNKEVYFVSLAETEISYERKMADLKNDLLRPLSLKRISEVDSFVPNLNQKQYAEKIVRIKSELQRKGMNSLNFALRFKADFTGDLADIFSRMQLVGKKGQAFLFDCDDFMVGGKARQNEADFYFDNNKALLIDEFEDYKRGLFGGLTGYNSFSGRSAFYEIFESFYCNDNRLFVQKGEIVTPESDEFNIVNKLDF